MPMKIPTFLTLLLALLVWGQGSYATTSHAKRANAHATTEVFHFRNGFWINLHHYLYAQALATSDSVKGRLRSSAEDAIQNAPCQDIPEAQRADWERAIDYYRTNYTAKDWLFDNDMRRLNDVMGDAGDS